MKRTYSPITIFLALLLLEAIEPSTCIPTTKAKNLSTALKQRQKALSNLITKAGKQLPSDISSFFNKSTKEVTVVDYGSIVKYVLAMSVQVGLSFGMWLGVDWILQLWKQQFPNLPQPRLFKFLMVYFLNLQVGKFNPLPKIPESSISAKNTPNRIIPSWTPPGWVFTLMWPLFVFGTRAYTMVMIADNAGKFSNPVMLSMMIHFSFASLWNSINRVDQQLGVSALMLYGLFISKAYAAYLAYQIDPKAGIALVCTLTWLGAAAASGIDTWRLNPNPKTGKRQPLIPTKTKQLTT